MNKVVRRKFTYGDLKKRFEVPFAISMSIDMIEIQINTINKSSEEAIIDIGLADSKRIRGWTGRSKTILVITNEYATPGYTPGKLIAGTWNLLLSVYKIPKCGCEIEITIILTDKHYRWLKGDTHFHTNHSDGSQTISEYVEFAKGEKYDYLISTEHNTVSQNSLLPTDAGMTIIPGVELTTYLGHANLIGLKSPINDFRCNNIEDVKNKFSETKENGGYVGINHPFNSECDGCDWRWGFDFEYDWLEVWNSIWSPDNQKTLNYWHDLLCNNIKIPILGGSDAHKIVKSMQKYTPTTFVYTNSLNRGAILNALKNGNSYISSTLDGPILSLPDDVVLGKVIDNHNFCGEVSNLQVFDTIKLISDRGIEVEYEIKYGDKFNIDFQVTNQKFIRIEVSRLIQNTATKYITMISNPVYYR